jgi:hypothetical protein
MSNPSPSRTRLAAAAGLIGAVAALTAITGVRPAPSLFQLTGSTEDVSGNCDEAEHVDDPSCVGTLTARTNDDTSTTSSTVADGSPSTVPAAGQVAADVRTFQAGEAGSVLVAVDGSGLELLTAAPNQGWRVEVEQATGREVEVTFRSGTRRVDLNLELEDGQVRERLRTRDDATDTRTETINGDVTDDDNSGPGSGDDDPGDVDDDNSGHGSNDNDDDDDDGSVDD